MTENLYKYAYKTNQSMQLLLAYYIHYYYQTSLHHREFA